MIPRLRKSAAAALKIVIQLLLLKSYHFFEKYFLSFFQAKALANAVFAYASHIDDLEKLTGAIEIIAQKHVSFSIPPNSYNDVGTELLKSIKGLKIFSINSPV